METSRKVSRNGKVYYVPIKWGRPKQWIIQTEEILKQVEEQLSMECLEVGSYLVYGLLDPQTRQIRYVGKSSNGLVRPNSHTSPHLLKKKTHTYAWLRKLVANEQKPEVIVLEEYENDEAAFTGERAWIAFCSKQGCKLTNHSKGGNGTASEQGAWINRKKPEELIENHRKKMTGRKWTQKHRDAREAYVKSARKEAFVRRCRVNRGVRIVDNYGQIYLSYGEAAEKLNVNKTLIYNSVQNGALVRGEYRFRRLEADE